jgi:ABC-type iron transport system FetAB permease component
MKNSFMRLNNQAQVGLVTVVCLLCQGYVFSYILKIEPNPLVSFVPLLPYIAYIYARGKRTWYHNKPLYWIAGIIVLTLFDVLFFVFWPSEWFV